MVGMLVLVLLDDEQGVDVVRTRLGVRRGVGREVEPFTYGFGIARLDGAAPWNETESELKARAGWVLETSSNKLVSYVSGGAGDPMRDATALWGAKECLLRFKSQDDVGGANAGVAYEPKRKRRRDTAKAWVALPGHGAKDGTCGTLVSLVGVLRRMAIDNVPQARRVVAVGSGPATELVMQLDLPSIYALATVLVDCTNFVKPGAKAGALSCLEYVVKVDGGRAFHSVATRAARFRSWTWGAELGVEVFASCVVVALLPTLQLAHQSRRNSRV